jgi:hypothetical protein
MLGPAHPRLPLGCAPSVRTRPVDGSDCPLVVKHDGFTGSQRQHHTPEQTHSHPVSRLVTDGTVGPTAGSSPKACKGDWVSLGIPTSRCAPDLLCAPEFPGLPIAFD